MIQTPTPEQALLSALLLWPERLDDVVRVLKPTDFYQPTEEHIYTAMVALADEGVPIDGVTVGSRLATAGHADLQAFVFELTDLHVVDSSVPYYVDEVKKASERRQLAEIGTRLTQLAANPEWDPVVVASGVREDLDGFGVGEAAGAVSLADDWLAFVDRQEKPPSRLATPWLSVDAITGGLPPGLIVIGARPGVGKSTLALQLASWLARDGNVLFMSLEMGRAEIYDRLIAQTAAIPFDAIAAHRLDASEDAWTRAGRASSELATRHLVIADQFVTSMPEIVARIRAEHRKAPLRAVFLDYLQIIDAPANSGESRAQVIAGFSRRLHLISQQLGIPVIALSQLNRAGAEESRPPRLTDLRESGAIEQDATQVWLLHQPSSESKFRLRYLDVHIAKSRSSDKGKASLAYEPQYMRVSEPPPKVGTHAYDPEDRTVEGVSAWQAH